MATGGHSCGKLIYVQKNHGFSNILAHLTACLGEVPKQVLRQAETDSATTDIVHTNTSTSTDTVNTETYTVVDATSKMNPSHSHSKRNHFAVRIGDKHLAVYKAMRIIIKKHLPISIVDDNDFRSLLGNDTSNLLPCGKTLRYMFCLGEIVQEKIKAVLPQKFALITDDWTHGSVHYCGMMAVFNQKLKIRVSNSEEIELF